MKSVDRPQGIDAYSVQYLLCTYVLMYTCIVVYSCKRTKETVQILYQLVFYKHNKVLKLILTG